MIRFPLAAALAAAMILCESSFAEEKVPLPASPPLMQVLASIDRSGRLVFRMSVPEYRPRVQPASEGGKEKQVTAYEMVHREQTGQVDPKEVETYDSHGKEVDAKDLPALLKRETLALYAAGEKLDPLQLRLVKDGTLIFLYTPRAPGLGQGPAQPAATPVPGLAELLKKQGYLAVPIQPHADDYLSVRVTACGKELRLIVDTGPGAPASTGIEFATSALNGTTTTFATLKTLKSTV